MTTTSNRPGSGRITRSTQDRKLAGVAGGLAHYLDIDPALTRIAFVLLTLAGGSGVVAYLVAWLILPEDDGIPEPPGPAGRTRGVAVIGGLLIVLGLLALIDVGDVIDLGPWGVGPIIGPVLLIGGGAWLLLRDRPTTSEADRGRPGGSDESGGSDVELVERAPWLEEFSGDTETTTGPTTADAAGTAPTASATAERPSATLMTTGVLLIGAGVVGLGQWAGWWSADPVAVIAAGLVIVGLGLLASAWLGRGRLLIPLGLVLALALGAVAAIDVPLRGGIGERTHRPADLAQLDDEYRLGIGQLTLDLAELDDLDEGQRRIEASVGIGELLVYVPAEIALDVDLEAGAGEIELLLPERSVDRRADGTGAEIGYADERPDGFRLELEARVGLGQVRVIEVG